MTLNIHKGFSFFNRRSILEELKAGIRELGADIVCLQEVLGGHEIHAKRPQFEHLADSIWSHYAYGRNAVYTKGHHGNAILSQFPIESFENFDISNHRLERRGILHATILLPADLPPGSQQIPPQAQKKLHVMTVHLDLLSIGRKRQLARLTELIRRRVLPGESLIVAGDFNDWSEEATDALLGGSGLEEAFLRVTGDHARTYPSQWPLLKLDRIYVRDLVVESAARVEGGAWSSLSDHLGLVADVRFPLE
jgi:endonuclease/exonuclease/phosphatase family metal-dependent hydrolase